MAEGSRIRELVKSIIRETIAEQQQVTQATPPMQGTVTSLNDDGSVNVNMSDGTVLQNIGAAIVFTIGAQVIVITAQGVRVAVPYQ